MMPDVKKHPSRKVRIRRDNGTLRTTLATGGSFGPVEYVYNRDSGKGRYDVTIGIDERVTASEALPPPDESTLAWQRTFTEAKDKAIRSLAEKGIPLYTVKNGKVVEVDPSDL